MPMFCEFSEKFDPSKLVNFAVWEGVDMPCLFIDFVLEINHPKHSMYSIYAVYVPTFTIKNTTKCR